MAEQKGKQGQMLFGEANLAYIRAGFALGFLHGEAKVKLVPPATARLAVFGKGTIKASEIWPLLNPNAADAVGLALYAAGFRYKNGEKK